MKNIAIIFAGGTGQRVGADIPKQFLKVCGKEIIVHTLELFEENKDIDDVYLVCIEDWIPYVKDLISKFDLKKVKSVVPGGKTGQDSIFIGLSEVKKKEENAVILLHDGVRPLVTQRTISTCVNCVHEFGSGIPVIAAYETPIHSFNGEVVDDMPIRKEMYLAQAPQGFYLNDIYNVHLEERKTNPDYEKIVDSCGLMFKHGFSSHLFLGDHGNIKVTTPEDFFTLIGNFNAKDYEQLLRKVK